MDGKDGRVSFVHHVNERLVEFTMNHPQSFAEWIRIGLICLPLLVAYPADAEEITFQVVVDRGADRGQSFGSLFETTTDDGSLVIGAGFQNVYNTRNRADRHALQFFVRPTDGRRDWVVQPLPRPNDLCGTYLHGRDEVVHAITEGLKAWDDQANAWRELPEVGGTQETMRVGSGLLEFGDSLVKYEGKTILSPPSQGSYQLFYYANGFLCFYHVHRGTGGYRAYQNDGDGFSKLYACRWAPGMPEVDLSGAIVMTLPVVGETTFAWGQLGPQIVTGSNVGGFYVLREGAWRMLLEPDLNVSYQLYSTMAFHDRLLMGQYPTGRLFEYDGEAINDLTGWPPVLPGVSTSAREAQTTVIYGGEPFVGVWPWGELWRYQPDAEKWSFVRRMFDHPELSDQIIHPYDRENRGHAVGNLWGQRVTSLVTRGPDLFVATSAKSPYEWDAEQFPFLAPDKWQSYGMVYRLTMPGHLGAAATWTDGPTTFKLTLRGETMSISQDGRKLSETIVTGPLAERLQAVSGFAPIQWGDGIYGRFAGPRLEGTVSLPARQSEH